MSTNFEKFRTLLEELFQLDQADLDFGIYRIMNQKRDEVVRFLDKDLLPQVKEAFAHYQSADKAVLQKELDKLTQQIEAAGMNPSDSPKFRELQEQYDTAGFDATAVENEVFSHLYNFFRRYYHEGDFISLRRYKEGVYAIPYEGEEVKLHWANHDQYYVKSSEYFRDYIFTTPAGKRVHFALAAASSEQDNKKEAAGKERRFIICAEDPIYEENGELFIRFEYRPDDDKKKQDALNQEAIERVLNSEGFDDWIRELSKPAPTKANPKRTVLEKHLAQYTARNTFDYFIHKDLGGFLRRELDFYIKNEVMHLDDIEHDTVPRVEQYLSKIKVIRKIAHKVIQFLEQLENFQKKLWLKKKFVVETNYCVTLDRVPEELYLEIAANDAQREEWVRLFAIDKIEKYLNGPGYSKPLTVEFLSHNPNLVVDTRFFSQQFRDSLLSSFDELDSQCDGLLVNSENFQALHALTNQLQGSVTCSYIDPPFKTGRDFLYKDSYLDSSWIALILSRLQLLRPLIANTGSVFVHLDEKANYLGRQLLDNVFGKDNFQNELIWHYQSGGRQVDAFSHKHDTIFFYQKSDQRLFNSDAVGVERGSVKRNNMKKQVDEDGRVYFSITSAGKEYRYYEDEKIVPDDVWSDISHLQQKDPQRVGFLTQKPEHLLRRVILCSTVERDRVLDFFCGSGTTLAAAHKLGRRWCGVEVGHHFDDILLPRMKRVLAGDSSGISRDIEANSRGFFKYVRLESYEDALNNLELKRTDQQGSLLEQDDDLREQYVLSYMLDVESRGSQSLLNVESFRNPNQYNLRIERNGETQLVNVDLVETFNWLLGLTVKHIDVIRGVRVVEGRNPDGDRTLALWRNLDEIDNNALDEWFKKQGYNTKDQEYDLIYVNGDNNLENLRRGDQTWKVRLIEEEFKRLMFDVEDI